jgi:hypothetical protein
MQRLAGIFLIAGSILWLYGAFTPISNRFFLEPDPQKRLAIIEADPTGWAINNVLWGVGAVVVAVGLVLFARHIQQTQDAGLSRAAYLAAGAFSVAALEAVMGSYRQLDRPPQEWVLDTSVPWTFYAALILMQVALLTIGGVLLRAGYPRWFGWTVLVLAGLTLIVLALVRDFPPLLLYLITLFMGIVLVAIKTTERGAGPRSGGCAGCG